MTKILKILVLTAGLNLVWGQAPVVISGLTIEGKQNGVFLRIHSDKAIDLQDVSGWIRKDRFYYLTIMNSHSDSAAIMATPLIKPVKSLELTHLGESTQLAFELSQPVESFDIFQSPGPSELLISLRFPIKEVFATLQTAREKLPQEPIAVTPATKPAANTYTRVRTALYLTGTSLAVAGIIDQDNRDDNSWELIAGAGIILGTYLYDRYIKPLFND